MRASALLLLSTAAALFATSAARSITYALPPETVPAELARPDAEAVVACCSGCHSLDYLSTQPRGKGVQFWRDAVNKMIHVYGAPVPAGDVDRLATTISAHLDRTD